MDTETSSLVEYGIRQERVKWRAHVCFDAQMVYFFRVADGSAALEACPERTASQSGQVTARGRLVPVEAIPNIQAREIPKETMIQWWKPQDASESIKGQAAVEIVKDLLYGKHKGKLVPLREVQGKQEQYSGADLSYFGEKLQVKCDYRGGAKERGGTGNLFLQTHESNPFQKH